MIPLYAPKAGSPPDKSTADHSKALLDELVRKLKEHAPDAGLTLELKFSPVLYGLIRRLIADDELAEKVLQLTFCRVLSSIAEYDPSKYQFLTWMISIARKIAGEELMKQPIPLKESSSEVKTNGQATLRVIYTSNDNRAHDSSQMLTDSIDPKYRIILNLIYFQGFGVEEIAQRFSLPPEEVRKRLALAIRQLRSGCGEDFN